MYLLLLLRPLRAPAWQIQAVGHRPFGAGSKLARLSGLWVGSLALAFRLGLRRLRLRCFFFLLFMFTTPPPASVVPDLAVDPTRVGAGEVCLATGVPTNVATLAVEPGVVVGLEVGTWGV